MFRAWVNYALLRQPRSPNVAGSTGFVVAEVDVVVVEVELVLGEDPTLLVRTVQPPCPGLGAYDLIRPPPWREVCEHPANGQHVGVLAVALYGFPVNVPDVGRPAMVVGVGQPAGLPITLRYARTVLDAREKEVALLEDVDADTVLPRYGPQSLDESRVHDPGPQVAGRLARSPEVWVIQKLSHGARALRLVFPEEARIEDAPPEAWWARRIQALFARAVDALTGDGEDSTHAQRRRDQDSASPDQSKSSFALTFVFYDGPQ